MVITSYLELVRLSIMRKALSRAVLGSASKMGGGKGPLLHILYIIYENIKHAKHVLTDYVINKASG